jgi:hypothetical protein
MKTRCFPFVLCAVALGGCSEDKEEEVHQPPPPISGGTLLVTADGLHAIAADADRDRVFVVDLAARAAREIVLEPGDEPGRVAEDASGRAHVALRRGGAVVTIDVGAAAIVARTPVCAAPRGIAYDPALDALHVACLGGDLVSLHAADQSLLRRVHLDHDLRDVVLADGRLLVSRFRSAEVLAVGAGGELAGRSTLPRFSPDLDKEFAPTVAWRTLSLPTGGYAVFHQRAMVQPVPLPPPGSQGFDSTYGNAGGSAGDPGIVHSCISIVRPGGARRDPNQPTDPLAPLELAAPLVPMATLPVDGAVSPDGATLALAAAGSGAILVFDVATLEQGPAVAHVAVEPRERTAAHGQPIAVAYDPSGTLWVQTRRPATVQILGQAPIALGEEPAALGLDDAAHDLFHLTAGDFGSMACASCHPEGADDGHTWSFAPFDDFDGSTPVLRRTQTLRGGLTEGPYHWDGALSDIDALVSEVMVARMGGAPPGEDRVAALGAWLRAAPRFPVEPPADPAAAVRGQQLFFDADVGCSSCHAGEKLTNDETVDVGTSGKLQVPTLVGIAHRAPYMHDGCAATLLDRFGPCGGGDAHGHTSQLSASRIADLVAYLETL